MKKFRIDTDERHSIEIEADGWHVADGYLYLTKEAGAGACVRIAAFAPGGWRCIREPFDWETK